MLTACIIRRRGRHARRGEGRGGVRPQLASKRLSSMSLKMIPIIATHETVINESFNTKKPKTVHAEKPLQHVDPRVRKQQPTAQCRLCHILQGMRHPPHPTRVFLLLLICFGRRDGTALRMYTAVYPSYVFVVYRNVVLDKHLKKHWKPLLFRGFSTFTIITTLMMHATPRPPHYSRKTVDGIEWLPVQLRRFPPMMHRIRSQFGTVGSTGYQLGTYVEPHRNVPIGYPRPS